MHNLLFIISYSIAFFLHAVGFWLLYYTNYTLTFSKIQRLYLLNLSFAEILICFISVLCQLTPASLIDVSYYIYYVSFGGSFLLYLIYYLITIDRFLIVYLNIKYHAVITMKEVRIAFCICYGISGLVTMTLFVLNPKQKIYEVFSLYIVFPGNLLFILLTILVYSYIVFSIHKRRSKLAGSSRQRNHQSNRLQLLPILLIASFIIFFIIPSVTYTSIRLSNESTPPWLNVLLEVVYGAGYSTDAILYIFSLEKIKDKFKRQKDTKRSSNIFSIAKCTTLPTTSA